MIASLLEFDDLKSRLERYAAVAGGFKPGTALRTILGTDTLDDPVLLTRLLSAIASDCIIDRQEDGDVWTMRVGPRRKILKMGAKVLDGLDQLRGDRTVAMLADALSNTGELASETIAARLEANTYDLDRVEQHIHVLNRVGPSAPGYSQIEALKSLYSFYTRSRQTDEILKAGFVGRENAIFTAMEWIKRRDNPNDPLLTLHITGLPGIGKSFLLERIIQLTQELEPRPILVRLDFDRSALRVDTPMAFFFEISRQIAEERPALALGLRNARVTAIETDQESPSRQMEIPRELFDTLIKALNSDPETRVVFILDTLEALRAQGDTHVSRLFEHLDMINQQAACDLRIVSAGRADALAREQARVTDTISLDGLEEWAARELLKDRHVPEEHWAKILPVAKGIPLRLVLAGKAADLGVLEEGGLPRQGPKAAIEGYLYRAILSRVPEHIRKIANEGLIVHVINADVLREVVAPAIGLEIDLEQAQDMLNELQRQHWLVKKAEAEDSNFIMHRDDIRSMVLNLIYADSPDLTAKIDARAADWFRSRLPVTALYHRLQMMRHGESQPEIAAELAVRFTDPMLSDLLPEAADAVLQARRQRSSYSPDPAGYRTGSAAFESAAMNPVGSPETITAPPSRLEPLSLDDVDLLVPDPSRGRFLLKKGPAPSNSTESRIERDLEIMLERNDLREATHIVSDSIRESVAPDSSLGRLVMALQWRQGHWSLAERLFKLQAQVSPDEVLGLISRPLVLAWFEIWAEYRFDDLVLKLKNRDLFDQVMKLLYSSEDIGLAGGALAFAVIAAAPQGQVDSKGPTYLRTAFAAAAPSLNQFDYDMSWQAFEAADSRRKSAGFDLSLKASDPRESSGRRLAPLNPYTVPILERIRIHEKRRDHSDTVLLRYLRGLYFALPTVAQLYVPELQGPETRSEQHSNMGSEIAALLADMGLTAHWTDAFGYVHPMSDLPALGRAAERWRRTANGLWSYGRLKPEGWYDVQDCDWEMLALRDHLAESGLAKEALNFWSGPSDSEVPRVHARMIQRLEKAGVRSRDRVQSETDPNFAFAANLLSTDVPLALAAPYSLLEDG